MAEAGAKCPLCLDLLLNGHQLQGISCGHVFHTLCLQKVVEQPTANKCPECRQPFVWPGAPRTPCLAFRIFTELHLGVGFKDESSDDDDDDVLCLDDTTHAANSFDAATERSTMPGSEAWPATSPTLAEEGATQPPTPGVFGAAAAGAAASVSFDSVGGDSAQLRELEGKYRRERTKRKKFERLYEEEVADHKEDEAVSMEVGKRLMAQRDAAQRDALTRQGTIARLEVKISDLKRSQTQFDDLVGEVETLRIQVETYRKTLRLRGDEPWDELNKDISNSSPEQLGFMVKTARENYTKLKTHHQDTLRELEDLKARRTRDLREDQRTSMGKVVRLKKQLQQEKDENERMLGFYNALKKKYDARLSETSIRSPASLNSPVSPMPSMHVGKQRKRLAAAALPVWEEDDADDGGGGGRRRGAQARAGAHKKRAVVRDDANPSAFRFGRAGRQPQAKSASPWMLTATGRAHRKGYDGTGGSHTAKLQLGTGPLRAAGNALRGRVPDRFPRS